MKPTRLIPPVIALAAGSLWIGSQRNSISKLEVEINRLTRHIERANATGADAPLHSAAEAAAKSNAVDWQKTAENMRQMLDGGVNDMRAMIRLQKQLLAMDADDLIAALAEIRALDVPRQVMRQLELMILTPLSYKDSKLALDTISADPDAFDDQSRWQIAQALGNWAKDDPGAAAAWLDEQIAAGKLDPKSLDGKNPVRLQLEGALLGQLISSDPGAASARINALPEDQRTETLGQLNGYPLKPADYSTYASLVRDSTSPDNQTRLLADIAADIAGSGELEKVDDYLETISATGEERLACATYAAKASVLRQLYNQPISRDNVDTMREWLAGHAPDSVAKTTGEILARTLGHGSRTSYEDVEKLVLEYHASSGSDELLTSFLGNWYVLHNNREQALALARNISDPETRAEVISNIERK